MQWEKLLPNMPLQIDMKFLVLDTNVLLRYMLHDVESQYKEAKNVFDKIASEKLIGKISILVLDELVWAFGKHYEIKVSDFVPKIMEILALKNIKTIEINKSKVMKIFTKMLETGIDFTDIYLSEIATKKTLFSFDKDFKKLF
ncbi:PIN domain-containing protein [Patescibacteria group bacterium]|nr:PIN domain-containing protein [Patescibacteria group bacterium]